MSHEPIISLDAVRAKSAFELQLLAVLPALRAFGRHYAANSSDLDDLVQETVVRALANSQSFAAGTNMKQWTFTILKNLFMTQYKNRKREPNPGNELLPDRLKIAPPQEWAVRQSELLCALNELSLENRTTLLEVAMGKSYDDTAAERGCEVGTVKSRVCRARSKLAARLGDLTHNDVYSACL